MNHIAFSNSLKNFESKLKLEASSSNLAKGVFYWKESKLSHASESLKFDHSFSMFSQLGGWALINGKHQVYLFPNSGFRFSLGKTEEASTFDIFGRILVVQLESAERFLWNVHGSVIVPPKTHSIFTLESENQKGVTISVFSGVLETKGSKSQSKSTLVDAGWKLKEGKSIRFKGGNRIYEIFQLVQGRTEKLFEKRTIDDSQDLLKHKRYLETIILYHQSLIPLELFLYAESLWNLGLYDEAIPLYKKIPNNKNNYLFRKMERDFIKKKWKRVTRIYRKFDRKYLETQKLDCRFYLMQGISQFKRKRPKSATQRFNKSSQLCSAKNKAIAENYLKLLNKKRSYEFDANISHFYSSHLTGFDQEDTLLNSSEINSWLIVGGLRKWDKALLQSTRTKSYWHMSAGSWVLPDPLESQSIRFVRGGWTSVRTRVPKRFFDRKRISFGMESFKIAKGESFSNIVSNILFKSLELGAELLWDHEKRKQTNHSSFNLMQFYDIWNRRFDRHILRFRVGLQENFGFLQSDISGSVYSGVLDSRYLYQSFLGDVEAFLAISTGQFEYDESFAYQMLTFRLAYRLQFADAINVSVQGEMKQTEYEGNFNSLVENQISASLGMTL